MNVVVGGEYRHFKGGVYHVICIATEDARRYHKLVIYQGIDGKVWARPIESFTSLVDADKYPEFDGYSRMTYLGEYTG